MLPLGARSDAGTPLIIWSKTGVSGGMNDTLLIVKFGALYKESLQGCSTSLSRE
jgi:hypothetical protein